ncbi:MAG: hypothetical protein JWR61_5793 [Ferruginibacter sp.]|nr:hypothetical protein [Ferruginibacter sp.]
MAKFLVMKVEYGEVPVPVEAEDAASAIRGSKGGRDPVVGQEYVVVDVTESEPIYMRGSLGVYNRNLQTHQ